MPDPLGLLPLVSYHQRYHQGLGVQDVYKLLYQACMGPRHLLKNTETAKAYLYEEWNRVSSEAATGPLTEPVSVDGSVLRLNLYPAKTNNITVETVWKMLYQSATQFREDLPQFLQLWQNFIELCKQGQVDFPLETVMALNRRAKQQNFPALHHSPEYRSANSPAYRVILKTTLDTINQSYKEHYDQNRSL